MPAGMIACPASAATWSSANTNVAYVDSENRIIAQSPGITTITATLKGKNTSITVRVSQPELLPSEESIDAFLATPASNAVYEIPVAIINYIPTPDGTNVETTILEMGTVEAFKEKLYTFNKRVKFMLEEGSRFRGYNDSNARPSLGYKVVKYITAYETLPPGKPAGSAGFFPDYKSILQRFNIGHSVSNLNVKEVWLWGYHNNAIVPWESDMSSPTTGDVSNSDRDNNDLPIYDRTYVLYNYNSMGSQNQAVHNHGHQLEAILGYANTLQDGNDNLFWENFCGRNPDHSFAKGRCGNTHFPPNADEGYDYMNATPVLSDCMDWTPAGTGLKTMVNSNTWGSISYAWPSGTMPAHDRIESQYYIFWMQNMPGFQNGISYGTNVMGNWWKFTADWDNSIQNNQGLYRKPGVEFAPGSISKSNGVFRATLTGEAGMSYAIESSSDLNNWSVIGTTTNFSGQWQLATPMNSPNKYFRAHQLNN